MSIEVQKGAVVKAEESRYTSGGPLPAAHKLEGAQTGGAAFVITGSLEPKRLVPPHTHTHEDEVTYIIEGEMTVEIGDQVLKAPAGSVVWKPRGVRHAMWNAGGEPLRYFEVVTPAGLEGFFVKIDKAMSSGTVSREDVPAIGREFGLEFDLAHTGELIAQYKLLPPM
jgi:quercetin dioxygenase-like cupin family protein